MKLRSSACLPTLRRTLSRYGSCYLFVLPALIFYLVFRYVPLYFVQVAFREFSVTRPVSEAPFAGLRYFEELFSTPGFWSALRNTFIINFYKLLVCFTAPILLAILLNELRCHRFKGAVQNILYLPHFVSWVVVGSILTNLLTVNGGVVNGILAALGRDPVQFLGASRYFRSIVVLSDLWRDAGYSAIIFIAALSAIDPQLYEAAELDGANWFQRMIHISLSGIRNVIVVMFILRVGNMITGNFDQIQTILNPQVYGVGDTVDTFVFRIGIQKNRYSLSAAAGLFNTVVAGVLLFTSDLLAKRFGDQGLF